MEGTVAKTGPKKIAVQVPCSRYKVQNLKNLAPRQKSVVLSRRPFLQSLSPFSSFFSEFLDEFVLKSLYSRHFSNWSRLTLWLNFHSTRFGPQRYNFIVVTHEDFYPPVTHQIFIFGNFFFRMGAKNNQIIFPTFLRLLSHSEVDLLCSDLKIWYRSCKWMAFIHIKISIDASFIVI